MSDNFMPAASQQYLIARNGNDLSAFTRDNLSSQMAKRILPASMRLADEWNPLQFMPIIYRIFLYIILYITKKEKHFILLTAKKPIYPKNIIYNKCRS